ncbi:MAG: ATP synthase F1 subunit delta [Actinobacteria bacterium]|jgi:F-type H+-transporting ATPase subunit delta|nr:ATP synthase F1 subunit delta [Actinomycetota bacterium]
MPDSIIEGYAAGLFRLVQAEGELDQVEDELYRFGKVLESNYELKQALSDQGIDRAQRIKVLDELLGEKVSPHSLGLLSFVVEQGHGRRLPEILERVSELAAETRAAAIAEVRTAVPLDEDQAAALAEALSKATGKKVELKVIIDPSVIGGVVTKIGDTVIDGTVRRRLEQLREQVS